MSTNLDPRLEAATDKTHMHNNRQVIEGIGQQAHYTHKHRWDLSMYSKVLSYSSARFQLLSPKSKLAYRTAFFFFTCMHVFILTKAWDRYCALGIFMDAHSQGVHTQESLHKVDFGKLKPRVWNHPDKCGNKLLVFLQLGYLPANIQLPKHGNTNRHTRQHNTATHKVVMSITAQLTMEIGLESVH